MKLYISERSVFPDNLEVAKAVVVYVWSWQNFFPCIDIVLIFFHILVLWECWVLMESIILLSSKPVLRGVRIDALPVISHEQTQ